MPVRARVGDHRGGAKRAFGGMDVGIKLDLSRTIGAGGNPRFLHQVKAILTEACAQVYFLQCRDAATLHRGGVAAVVTDQLACGGGKPQVRPAGVAGKSVVENVSHVWPRKGTLDAGGRRRRHHGEQLRQFAHVFGAQPAILARCPNMRIAGEGALGHHFAHRCL